MTKVYPTKAGALNVHHPVAGAPRVEGVEWPYDVFTMRRLSDGSFTEDASKAYKPSFEAAAADKPAAPASPVKQPESMAAADKIDAIKSK
jgi:hypothetical protein